MSRRLTSQIKDTLRLIARSKSDPDGWVLCSHRCWPVVDTLPAELYESLLQNDFRYVRLTDEAKTILKWM
jgi:hypothetical protein